METPVNRPIIVGIDGSANSLAALRWALREASATRSPVEVMHCWGPQTLPDLFLAPAHELQVASTCMLRNEVQAALAEMSDAPVVVELSLKGDPAAQMIDRSGGARLIVLGVRQTTVMRDLAHGATGSLCRKHALCPVVTVDRDGSISWHQPTHAQMVVG